MSGTQRPLWSRIGLVPERLSERSILTWLALLPVLLVRLGLIVCVVVLTLIVAMAYPRAFSVVMDKVQQAMEANTDSNSAQLKGEEWQRGNQQRGSLIRSGGSLNSDDLRRRLNELRSSKSGGPERRTPKTGGHYAKQ